MNSMNTCSAETETANKHIKLLLYIALFYVYFKNEQTAPNKYIYRKPSVPSPVYI